MKGCKELKILQRGVQNFKNQAIRFLTHEEGGAKNKKASPPKKISGPSGPRGGATNRRKDGTIVVVVLLVVLNHCSRSLLSSVFLAPELGEIPVIKTKCACVCFASSSRNTM